MTKKPHRITDPELGELIGIDELSYLTGFSKHTIRNWRKPSNSHLAKFSEVFIPGSVALYYRLDDVRLWLAEQHKDLRGNQTRAVIVERPNAVSAPVRRTLEPSEHLALTKLAEVTRGNVWQNFSRIQEKLDASLMPRLIEDLQLATDLWLESHPGEPDVFPSLWTFRGTPQVSESMDLLPQTFRMLEDSELDRKDVWVDRYWFVLVTGFRIYLNRTIFDGEAALSDIATLPLGSLEEEN